MPAPESVALHQIRAEAFEATVEFVFENPLLVQIPFSLGSNRGIAMAAPYRQ